MTAMIRKQWFLVGLAIVIPLGLWWGLGHSGASSSGEEAFAWLTRIKFSQVITATVLLLMAFSLDSKHLAASMRSPGPVLWASVVNYIGIPLLGWGLMGLQRIRDFEIGLMIAATVPCTLAAASVWTRKAQGNDAVSLMVTLLTNTICFVATPFWLNFTVGTGVQLDTVDMIIRLVFLVLIPTLLGQGLRQIPRLGEFATRQKIPIGVVAQSLILLLVGLAAVKAGQQLGGEGPKPSVSSILLVWGSCVLMHTVAMTVAWFGSGVFQFPPEDRVATVFAGSQKTLPVGVLIATAVNLLGNPNLFGPGEGIPFAVFPILMYHASQLFIDTVIADRLARRQASR